MLDIAIIAGKQYKKYFRDADNKSSMNTNNWVQHQRCLNKLCRVKIQIYIFLFGSKS